MSPLRGFNVYNFSTSLNISTFLNMKKLLFLLLPLLGLVAWQTQQTTSIAGRVTDAANGEALIGASIVIVGTTKGTVTDIEGRYRLEMPPGVYALEVSYTGYETQRIVDIVVEKDKETLLDVALKGGAMLEEVVVTGYSARRLQREHALSMKKADRAARRDAAKPAEMRLYDKEESAATAPVEAVPAMADDIVIVDGVRYKATIPFDPETYEERVVLVPVDAASETPALEDSPKEAMYTPERGQPAPRAGLLTAGEWNDLHNWSTHWSDLLKDGEIDDFQKIYGFYPHQRYTVLLTNELDYPLVDVPVTLHDRWGKTIWEARTDNTGKAELWANFWENKTDMSMFVGVAKVDGVPHTLGILQPYESGINRKQIRRACGASKNVDIVWAVDATGSMGDELEYLKTELLDVIGRVKSNNPELNIRMGSVFYRDKGDDYIVRSSALSPDIAKTVEYIGNQQAAGGGDYPEAVHSALDEMVNNQPWSADAVARICFLVLDASPHQDVNVLESIRQSIQKAARLGIRIVPVSGSGIQKDTEFLMKFFGLATNGTYTFLTDHSGIGGKHLEPTTDEYKVEQLNDLLVRIITEYTTVESCEGKIAIRFDDPQQQPDQPEKPAQQALYYPNPAETQFTLELPFDAQKVTLYNAEGSAVRNLAGLSAGRHSIQVQDLPAGFYTLRIWKQGQVQSGKVMVVRG
jgi:hypothetical protein